MRIAPEHIARKEIIGTSGDGKPIVLVETKGGLFACFTKNKEGEVVSLAAAPHIGIMKYLAEKEDPDLKWDEKIEKSESLVKSETAQFDRMRSMIFGQSLAKSELIDAQDTYFVYDTAKKVIEILNKTEIIERISEKSIDPFCVVRPLDLSGPADVLRSHQEFKKYGK